MAKGYVGEKLSAVKQGISSLRDTVVDSDQYQFIKYKKDQVTNSMPFKVAKKAALPTAAIASAMLFLNPTDEMGPAQFAAGLGTIVYGLTNLKSKKKVDLAKSAKKGEKRAMREPEEPIPFTAGKKSLGHKIVDKIIPKKVLAAYGQINDKTPPTIKQKFKDTGWFLRGAGEAIAYNSSTIADLMNLSRVAEGKRSERAGVFYTLGSSVGTTSTQWIFTDGDSNPFRTVMRQAPYAAAALPVALAGEKVIEFKREKIEADDDIGKKEKIKKLAVLDTRSKDMSRLRKLGAVGTMFLGNQVMRNALRNPQMSEIMTTVMEAANNPAATAGAAIFATTLLTSSTTFSLLAQGMAGAGIMATEQIPPALGGAGVATNFTGNAAAQASGSQSAKRVAAVNLISSCAALTALLIPMMMTPAAGQAIANVLHNVSPDPTTQSALFFSAFAGTAAGMTMPFVNPLLRGLRRVFPDKDVSDTNGTPPPPPPTTPTDPETPPPPKRSNLSVLPGGLDIPSGQPSQSIPTDRNEVERIVA
ncbi:MAG: hypothetical protein FWE38_03055 [Firmicutes bacterium]|nr:hypothetical protein [Bacillota bacterium]